MATWWGLLASLDAACGSWGLRSPLNPPLIISATSFFLIVGMAVEPYNVVSIESHSFCVVQQRAIATIGVVSTPLASWMPHMASGGSYPHKSPRLSAPQQLLFVRCV
ncbi:hypothetical protein BJY04DRAFT_198954 [Aspergillus karnatakaensis]|uniref:uncharacterized protein n=1 Tax=Aspergillus karnatakaensis TaxID=1810916 RepID=UPI003CCDC237